MAGTARSPGVRWSRGGTGPRLRRWVRRFWGHLSALDRSSGEVDWHRSSPTEILVAPALTANRLFVNDGRHLRAMAPETGEESWTRRVGGPGSVTVTTDRVFSLSRPRLDVFERATGSELGHFSMGTEFEWVPVPSSDGLFLALDDGRLVSLTNSGGPSLLALGLGLGGLGLLGLGGYETYRRHRE